MITVEVNIQHATQAIEVDRLRQAATAVLEGEGFSAARLSVAVVDDSTSHALNRRFLQHDYPTDVLTFPMEERPGYVEGEVIVSADQAELVCRDYGWAAENELLLYVIHGVLHLTGYDDQTDEDRLRMRGREQHYLRELGLTEER